MAKVELTKKLIDSLKFENRIIGVLNDKVITEPVPDGVLDYYIHDSDTNGLCLRLTRNGAKTFVVRKRLKGGAAINFVCGSFPDTTLNEARLKAKKAILDLEQGIDPNIKIKEQAALTRIKQDKQKFTFGIAFQQYSDNTFFNGFSEKALADIRAGLKEGTIKDNFSINTAKDHKAVEKWLQKTELWKSPFHEINLGLIEKTLRPFLDMDASTGNKIFRYCRAAWNNANIGKIELARNPFSDWKSKYKPADTPRRSTSLDTDTEDAGKWLKTISKWKTDTVFHKRVMADYVLLTLIWGTRKNEALPLEFQYVYFDRKALTIVDPKNGVAHWLPITPLTEQLLLARKKENDARNAEELRKADYVFPSRIFNKHLTEPSSLLEDAKKESGLKITLHDLRRTFAGEIYLLSRDSLTTKLAMNHSSGTNDITASYIMIKAKLETLRPLFEQREQRLFKLAGLTEEKQAPLGDLLSEAS